MRTVQHKTTGKNQNNCRRTIAARAGFQRKCACPKPRGRQTFSRIKIPKRCTEAYNRLLPRPCKISTSDSRSCKCQPSKASAAAMGAD